jgi:PAS domain-containing protein
MAKYNVQPTNNEATFGQDEIIVSKTDLTGRILYANDVFLRVAGFGESEVLNQPHSMIRHPDMPRAVFNPHFPDELVNRCPEMEIML